jgi:preprotein translocase subunit YajC
MPADLILLALVAVMLFFIFGQNRKRRQAAEQLASAIAVGDEVILHSGIVGSVVEVDEEIIVVKSSTSKLKVLRAAVRVRKAPEGK